MSYTKVLGDEQAMLNFGAQIAKNISSGLVIFLNGDLGAGKTTLVRGFLRQLGYNGAVKSPTFTLVENYTILDSKKGELTIFHFDLYRLCDPEELDYMGMSDYLDGKSIVLIEWPEKGEGFLPPADIVVDIHYLEKQREITIKAQSSQADLLINNID